MNLHSSDYCGAGEDVMGSASRDVYEKTCQLLEKSCRWSNGEREQGSGTAGHVRRSSIGAMCLHSVSSNVDAATTAARSK